MPDDALNTLRDYLLASGMSSRYVHRAVAELRDHRADLLDEAHTRGLQGERAAAYADERLGDPIRIARGMARIEAHRAWIYRYPRIARLYLPMAYCVAVPLARVTTGDAGSSGGVLRWGAAMMLSAAVTAAMLLCMQLAIILG